MKRKRFIQLIAAFIMVVFSLNTVIGFACAVGLDMKFNTSHHEEVEATKAVVHVHSDGKKHVHQEKAEKNNHHPAQHNKVTVKTPVHIHPDGKKHIHQEVTKHDNEPDKDHHKTKESKDNCCNEQVIKFNEVDKSFSHSLNTGINPTFFTAFVSSFYNIDILYTSYVNTNIKYFVRSYHPPIPDIRIAIQSFQI